MSLNELPTVRSPAQTPTFHGGTSEKDGQPEVMRDRGPLLGLARKLHENETTLAFMRHAFRLFQRIGITVSPNHYSRPGPTSANSKPEMASRGSARRF